MNPKSSINLCAVCGDVKRIPHGIAHLTSRIADTKARRDCAHAKRWHHCIPEGLEDFKE